MEVSTYNAIHSHAYTIADLFIAIHLLEIKITRNKISHQSSISLCHVWCTRYKNIIVLTEKVSGT